MPRSLHILPRPGSPTVGEATDPLHHLALAIAKRIRLEIVEQRVAPPQPQRARSLFLPVEKDGG
jgi:hypothetical protein